jgi:hypothetical protein
MIAILSLAGLPLTIPLLAVLVIAQQTSGPQRGANTTGSKKSVSSAGTPTPAAIGNDIVKVVNSLVAAGATKTKQEFETTEEFEAQQRALASRYGQLTFVLPERRRFEPGTGKETGAFVYDADAGRMLCFVGTDDRFLNDFRENADYSQAPIIVLKSVLAKQGSYVGTNVFGVTRRIDTSTTIEHGIIISLSSTVRSLPHAEEPVLPVAEFSFSFPLDISQARALKPFLRVLIVGHLVEAHVYKGSMTWGAGTLDMPYNDEHKGTFLHFSIDDLRIVDKRSGKTIATPSPE